MNPYIITEIAASDIADIWSYIAEDNSEAADRVLQQLYAEFSSLTDFPGAGRRREEVAPGLRSFPVGSYIIFYRIVEDAVHIQRVLHGARHVRKSMFR